MLYQLSYASPEVAISPICSPTNRPGTLMRNRLPTRKNSPGGLKQRTGTLLLRTYDGTESKVSTGAATEQTLADQLVGQPPVHPKRARQKQVHDANTQLPAKHERIFIPATSMKPAISKKKDPDGPLFVLKKSFLFAKSACTIPPHTETSASWSQVSFLGK